MYEETVINTRPDREIRKKIITPGDYSLVPYEDSRCKITISEIQCKNEAGECEIEVESLIFSSTFDGNVLIGDSDSFIDKDFELILQQMCCGETCNAIMVYRDNLGALAKEIKCKIELREVMEEQLISDWGWERLYEASLYHKEKGVELVKQKRICEAFRRFNKALKMLIAIEPIDPEQIKEDKVKEMVDLKVKLYNNLAHCQLQYNECDAALQLCNKALSYHSDNAKALYRRCLAYSGLNMYEEAWVDIQNALKHDPNDKVIQHKVNMLRPVVEKRKQEYSNVIKKMFG
ncbi:hypothetical protein K1T71_010571 [Dendrolimus kikuchii]|uniref:Uncharacterized protein n=1 Tax=Dendrolimus kikuchii TaxID=765133 RepID=A0ACC1CPL9_9NEOP|nr:hypothetical protein K1T71_010571 [Dendrolimus kikuchii]